MHPYKNLEKAFMNCLTFFEINLQVGSNALSTRKSFSKNSKNTKLRNIKCKNIRIFLKKYYVKLDI